MIQASCSETLLKGLSNVIIQDPIRQANFFIPATELIKFEATSERWAELDSSTIIFVIPDEYSAQEVPAFINPTEQHPSILIQYPKGATNFFLTYDDLNDFKAELNQVLRPENTINFVIPSDWGAIEELPLIRRVGASAVLCW